MKKTKKSLEPRKELLKKHLEVEVIQKAATKKGKSMIPLRKGKDRDHVVPLIQKMTAMKETMINRYQKKMETNSHRTQIQRILKKLPIHRTMKVLEMMAEVVVMSVILI